MDSLAGTQVAQGAVAWKVGAVERYTPTGVTLASAEVLAADVVIYGTGFAKDYSVFDAGTRARLNVERDGLHLYRHTVPTGVANLAFVGSELATVMNITTYGLQVL